MSYNSKYQYQLEDYKYKKSKHQCPSCGKRGRFTRYVNVDTGEYLSAEVGRCDREVECGYHYTPRLYFEDNEVTAPVIKREFVRKPEPPVSYLPISLVDNRYKMNNLYGFLISKFDDKQVDSVFAQYLIGSSNMWPNSTVFYQYDKYGRCRTGKVMQYDRETGNRVKEPSNRISWLHCGLEQYNLKQCLFGMHLVTINDNRPVAIVESEKTALIMAIIDDRFIWLASGGLSNLKVDLIKSLGFRKVILFPDSGCADKWEDKVKGFNGVVVNRSLEKYPSGTDLADVVLSIT